MYGVVAVKRTVKLVEFALLVEELKARPLGFEAWPGPLGPGVGVGALRLGHSGSLFGIETSLYKAFGVEVGVGGGEVLGEGLDKGWVSIIVSQDFGDSFKVFLVMIGPR